MAESRQNIGHRRGNFRNKHKISGNGKTRFPQQYLHETFGLLYLPALTHNLPWATA